MWPILIKADDLFLDANLGTWSRFIKIVDKNKGCVDIGFISKAPTTEEQFNEFTKWLNGINRSIISFFDHGIRHDQSEYTQTSEDYYFEQFRLSHEFQLKLFGYEFEGFGAPYNSMCIDFLKFYRNNFKERYIYYPDIVEGSELSDMNYVSHKYHTSFEQKKLNYDPSLTYLRATYSKALTEHRPLVLQVHPNRWSEEGFVQFSEILTYLRRLGGSFLNARDFINSTLPKLQATSTLSLNKKIGEWFVDRYSQESLTATKGLAEKVLSCAKIDANQLSNVVDFGAGVGDWIYVLASMNPAAKFYAVEPNKELAEFAANKFTVFNQNNVEVINAEFNNAILNDINLTLCNRALNYFDPVIYVNKLSIISIEGSYHYVGYQNIAFYLRGLLSALKSGNIELAKRRVNVLISSLEYLSGIPDRKTNETCVPVCELIKLFEYFGFKLMGESHQEGIFCNGVGSVTGLVFVRSGIKEGPLESNLEHLGLVTAIESSGTATAVGINYSQGADSFKPQLLAIHNGMFESLESWFQRDKPLESQKIQYISSIIAAFEMGKYRLCEDLLSLCNFNDF